MKRRGFIRLSGAAGAAGLGLAGSSPSSSSASGAAGSALPFLTPWSPPRDRRRVVAPGKTPIRLTSWSSTTTLDYPKDGNITGMVKRIRDSGFSAGVSHPGQRVRSPWLDASEGEIRELKDALRTYDVLFADMHANANNIHPDLAERARENRWTILECEAAERVGCTVVSTHTGSCAPSAISPHPDNWTLETWKLSVKIMKQLLKETAGMKVSLAIEPDNMAAINNPRAHRRLIEDVGEERLKVCFDPVNMIEAGNYYRTKELIEESFDLLDERIIIAHAKDSLILPERMSMYITEAPPGKGVLDYTTYLSCLSRLEFPRALLVEHLSDKEYPAAVQYIRDTAERAGVEFYE
jgi:sugar phosphate isomerase/epimerase